MTNIPPLAVTLAKTASAAKWQRLGARRRAGVIIPLFSMRSSNTIGVGDLADLKLVIDWCEKTDQTILQLLPMNEMGATNCPYDALSSFALEPAYLALGSVDCKDMPLLRQKEEMLRLGRGAMNGHADFGVKQAKVQVLWDVCCQEGAPCEALKEFRRQNAYWLDDFALFKVLKASYKGLPWYEWDEQHRRREAQALERFAQIHEREIMFQSWVQWLLYLQLKDAKSYAASRGVLLKGDLPVLVSRDSADVWAHPEFFKLDFAAGAPPDMYCAKGQRWGMPPYNWETIAADGYRYVKEKLRYSENFYDILRIDHVVGLFRLWSIPYNDLPENQGLHGFFDPSDEHAWEEHGRRILTVMNGATSMLLCAEDLGVIPVSCPKTLAEFGLPGNDVQRWVKDWNKRHDFLPPEEYRMLSVAVLSTHDTTNWAAWWEFEAGTVDEELFKRKCKERGIDFTNVKDRLFDQSRSHHGRLRWLDSITSIETLVYVLGRRREEVNDFVDLYVNSFHEKEKLWSLLALPGPVQKTASVALIAAACKLVYESRAVFCVHLITDLLTLADAIPDDYYSYRINTPGTNRPENWSLLMPLALEEFLVHPVNLKLKEMIDASARH